MGKNYALLLNFSKKFNKTLFYKKTIILTLFFVLTPFFNAWGQTDNCATTSTLTVGTVCSTNAYNVQGTFNNDGPIPCIGTSHRDGWFAFTTDATTHAVTIQGTSNRQLGLAVYSGSCGSLTQIACTVPGTANANLTSISVLPSSTYLLRLMRTNNVTANDMTGNICVFKTDPIVPSTGNNSYTMCSGNIYDNGGSTANYATSSNGYSVINPSVIGNMVQVSGSITAEAGYDYLTIYDGTGTGGTILWGGAPHGTGTACTTFTVPTITSTTGPLTVRFYSDGSTNCTGFNLTVNCYTPLPCTTPTAQPTVLNLTPTSTTIAGSFTAATPAPNSYLVVLSTSATPPSPVNGTTYTIGGTVGAGYTVVDTDSNTTFTATGLTPSTLYYVYVFSYNSACTGGPIYYTTSPLSGSTTTLSVTYCSPTSWDPDGLYINSVAFVGALTDPPVNTSTFNATGFQNFTTLPVKAIQAQGEGINIVARSNGTVHVRGTWKAWVDWNKNGTFQPATEEVYNIQGFAGADATFGFVIPPTTPPGDYRIRIRVNNGTDFWGETFGFDFLPCDNFTSGGTDNYGETEDYLFTVVTKCNSLITSITNGETCGTGTVNLGATATAGVTEFRWYTTATGGSYTTSPVVGSSTAFTTPSISTTTNYYVTAWNGTCETQVRTLVIAKVSPIPVVSFTPASPVICGENSIISLTATGDTEITHLINENFEGAGLGVFSNINNDANGAVVDAITSWKNQTSTYVPTTTNVWFPAVSSGFGTNKFALAYSDSDPSPTNTIENSIALTTAVNSNTFLNLTLKLKLYYSRYFPDGYIDPLSDEYVSIELSTNGGTTYPIVLQTFTSDVGIGTRFAELSYDLSAYINQPNLKIRVRHRSYAGTGWLPDGVAIDDVELFGTKPLNTAFNYDTATVDAFTNPGATIPYVSGAPATTIYIKPTLTQLENASFNIPVSATLSNGCSATGSITVTNNTKMFIAGTIGTDWNTGTNWKPNGVPTANNCVVIFDNDVNITGTNYTGYGLNLTVKPTGNLNIASSNSSIITDIVNIEAGGVLEVENNASLVQINNVANTGNIIYKRTAPSIRGFDYVYWSSPVANQNIETIYTSPISGLKYQWNPTVANGNGGQGNWETASGNMQRAKGYIIRGSSNYTMPATNIDATFTGIPHNGNIPFTISRGSYTGVPYNGTNGIQITNINDNYNLLGNPYPSAIDAQEFLATNTYHATTNPSGVIYGNVKLWTHGYQPAAIVNPFYGTFTYNYNANDYVTLNYLGASDPIGVSNIIKSGQAFLVQMIDGTAGSGTINFSNGMRLDASNNSYNNSGFFRTSTNEFEKHRIWLDLIDSNNIASGTLVAYATDATYGFDTFFDAQAAVPAFMKIYSLIGNDVYDIQGRSLPFDQNDQVPLGATFVEAGNYTIALNTIDGLFLDSSQNIFLEDKLTNNIHNLKNTPYSFTASAGTFHDRFVLRYTNTILGNEDFENNNNVTIFTNTNINVNSSVETIRSVQIFDLLGRDIAKFDNINNRSFSTQNIKPTQSALLVKVTLINGFTKIHKIIY